MIDFCIYYANCQLSETISESILVQFLFLVLLVPQTFYQKICKICQYISDNLPDFEKGPKEKETIINIRKKKLIL